MLQNVIIVSNFAQFNFFQSYSNKKTYRQKNEYKVSKTIFLGPVISFLETAACLQDIFSM